MQRALDLLNVLQTYQHPVRLTDLARHAGLHVATVQRMLNVLVDNGFAVRYASGYTAGPAALSVAHAYLVASPLNMIAQPIMQELSAECGLTSSLYVRVAGSRVLVARVEGANPLRYTLPVGERFPLYLGAAGKTILAFSDESTIGDLLADITTIEHADGTTKKTSEFRAELTGIRTQGYARSAGERVLGITAIAAPILDGSHEVQGALGLTGPSDELSGDQAQRIVPELRRAATAIGARYPVAA
ncbi:MAG: IclR family transcriptional regulator [Nakamurella sp.]